MVDPELRTLAREALESHVLEDDGPAGARLLEQAARRFGAVELAGVLLDTSAILLRRMVSETDEAYDASELLSQLALHESLPDDRQEVLLRCMTFAAATAGGIRPPIESLTTDFQDADVMFGAWLATLTTVKLVAIVIETTEGDLVDDLGLQFETF